MGFIKKNGGFLLLLLVSALLIAFSIIYLPGLVPRHHGSRALFFGAGAVFAGLMLLYIFLTRFDRYILLVFVLLPLFPYFEAFLSPIGGDLLRVMPQMLIVFLACLGIFVHKIRPKKDFINRFLLFWVLAHGLSLLFSKDPLISLAPFLSGVAGPAVFVYILHNRLLKDSNGFMKVLKAFILAFAAYIFFSVFLVIVNLGTLSLRQLYISRFGMELALAFYSSNGLACYSTFSLPLLFWLISNKIDLGAGMNILIRVLFITITVIVMTVVSRGGLILFSLYLMIFAAYLALKKHKIKLLSFWNLIMLFAFGSVAVYFARIPQYIGYVKERFYANYHGMEGLKTVTFGDIRLFLWNNSLQIFKDNWLTGVGLGNIRDEMIKYAGYDFDSHNLFLDILAENGIIVFALFISLIVYLTINAFKNRAERSLESFELNFAFYLGAAFFMLFGAITGGKLISTNEIVAGLMSYFLFTSAAMQNYLTARGADIKLLSK